MTPSTCFTTKSRRWAIQKSWAISPLLQGTCDEWPASADHGGGNSRKIMYNCYLVATRRNPSSLTWVFSCVGAEVGHLGSCRTNWFWLGWTNEKRVALTDFSFRNGPVVVVAYTDWRRCWNSKTKMQLSRRLSWLWILKGSSFFFYSWLPVGRVNTQYTPGPAAVGRSPGGAVGGSYRTLDAEKVVGGGNILIAKGGGTGVVGNWGKANIPDVPGYLPLFFFFSLRLRFHRLSHFPKQFRFRFSFIHGRLICCPPAGYRFFH